MSKSDPVLQRPANQQSHGDTLAHAAGGILAGGILDRAARWPNPWPIERVRVRVIVPLVVVTLLLAGGAIWLIDYSAIQTTRTRLAQLAISVAQQMDRDTEQIDALLDSGVRLLEGTSDINRADVNRLQEQIRPRLLGTPLMKGVIFSDQTGTRRMVTRDFNDPIYGFDSNHFYQDYLRNPQAHAFVGDAFRFTVEGVGIPVTRVVRNSDGRLKGLITVLLNSELLSEFYRSIAPAPSDNILLVQRDGRILTAKTMPAAAVAEALRVQLPQALAEAGTDAGMESFDLVTESGMLNYVAARPVPNLPILAIAMTTRQGVIHSWILQASIVASVILAAGLVLVAITLYLGRKIIANERSLLAQADFTNLIIDSAEVLIFVRNREGQIVRVNNTAERQLGYSLVELMDQEIWLSILLPEEREEVRATFLSQNPQDYPNRHDNYLIARNGEKRLYRWSNVAILDKSGRISLVIGLGEDITAAAQARQLEERSLAAMNHAQRMAGMRYYFHSPEFGPVEAAAFSFRAQMAEVLGIAVDDLPADQDEFIETFIHPDDRAATRQHYRAFNNETADQYLIEYRINKAVGEIRYIREGTKRLPGSVDHLTQSIGIIQDITDIRRTQLSLERHATLMDRAQGIARMCHWYFEPAPNPKSYDDGQYVYSDNAADIFGLPPAELNMPETDFAERLIHPDDRDFVYRSYRAFVEGPDLTYQRVYRLIFPDGSVRYISDAGEKRLTAEGRLLMILGISQDVTTMHKSEVSLRRTENQLRNALRIASMGHWHADRAEASEEAYVLQYSEEAAEIFGTQSAVLNGLAIDGFVSRFVAPEDQRQTLEKMQQFWHRDAPVLSAEFRILRSDGGIRIIRMMGERIGLETGASPAQAAQDNVYGRPSSTQIIGMVQDITDLRYHELVLRQTETLLQHAHRLARIGYWLWQPGDNLDAGNGKMTYSDGLRAMLGVDTGDYNSETETFCELYVHPEDRQLVLRTFQDYGRTAIDSYNLDYRFIRLDGEVLTLRSVAQRVRDESGQILHAIGVVQDITEQRQREEELIQAKNEADLANRSKTEFLANMSHELRTPLNAVIGFSQLIRDQAFGANPERYVTYAEDINTSGKLLLELINDILDMSRIEAGRHVLNEEQLSISDAVQDCLRLVSTRANEGKVTLNFIAPPDTPILYADSRSLKQILLNVLSNAVKFTPQNGRVDIEVLLPGNGGLNVAIRDTGIGIAPDVLPKLFAPFRQGDNSISRRFGGTGLGLAISRKLLELHDGSIEIESELGKGTVVRLHFPPERVIAMPIPGREPSLASSSVTS
ncbi:PAS domain-containing protein [Dongia soli]|uniref:histidine kinase n=1 Tax=Dongia soli TaxID=600628 RepID=A0ABU5E567_9PROT|nr:PAS domain-containing protein [Dongia soli]MDY0881427.1 PAS domain-containing protein [Dongia soli]